MIAIFWSFSVAHATPTISDCDSGDAPSGWDDETCEGVCAISGSVLICDLDRGSGSFQVQHELTLVSEFNGADTFSAWGSARGAGDFCCIVADPLFEVVSTYIYGTDQTSTGDILNATHAGTGSNVEVNSIIHAGDGADTVEGSDFDVPESIYGDGMADTIHGNDGVDSIEGNNGDDVITGGPKGDNILGGNGDDTISGNWGNDTIFGGDNADTLNGGDGVDTLRGDAGPDVLIGGPDGDSLYGGTQDDVLCSGTGTGDHLDGEGGADELFAYSTATSPTGLTNDTVDQCGHSTHGTSWVALGVGASCTYGLTKPAECP